LAAAWLEKAPSWMVAPGAAGCCGAGAGALYIVLRRKRGP